MTAPIDSSSPKTLTRSALGQSAGSAYWLTSEPDRDGYWWHRPHPGGRAQIVIVWRVEMSNGTKRQQVQHEYGTSDMQAMRERWPMQEWAGPIIEPIDLPNDQSQNSPSSATGVACGDLVRVPTPEERAANHRDLSKLHVGNRFRLMFGMPLLPQAGLKRRCHECNREYDSNT